MFVLLKHLILPIPSISDQRQELRGRFDGGETVSAIARSMKTSRQTIMRARDGADGLGCSIFGAVVISYKISCKGLPVPGSSNPFEATIIKTKRISSVVCCRVCLKKAKLTGVSKYSKSLLK